MIDLLLDFLLIDDLCLQLLNDGLLCVCLLLAGVLLGLLILTAFACRGLLLEVLQVDLGQVLDVCHRHEALALVQHFLDLLKVLDDDLLVLPVDVDDHLHGVVDLLRGQLALVIVEVQLDLGPQGLSLLQIVHTVLLLNQTILIVFLLHFVRRVLGLVLCFWGALFFHSLVLDLLLQLVLHLLTRAVSGLRLVEVPEVGDQLVVRLQV